MAIKPAQTPAEYIVVNDQNKKVIFSTTDFATLKAYLKPLRQVNAEVTVFKATKY